MQNLTLQIQLKKQQQLQQQKKTTKMVDMRDSRDTISNLMKMYLYNVILELRARLHYLERGGVPVPLP